MPKILLIISIVLIAVSAGLGLMTMGKKASLVKEVSEAKDAKQKATAEAATAKAQADAVKAQAGAAVEELKAAKADLAAAKDEAQGAKAKLTSVQDELQKANEKIANTPVTTGTVAPVAQVDDTKVKALEAEVAELKQVNQSMGPKLTEAENKAKSMEGELNHYKGVARAKGLEGQVLAVNNAYNFVVLSLGDRNGVVMNAQMLIFRGDKMVAKVKVTSVEPSTSIADIVPGSGPGDFRVMPGDRVVYSGA